MNAGEKSRTRILKRSLIDSWKSIRLYRYYKNFFRGFLSFVVPGRKSKDGNRERELIVMFDGKMKHGGISDRLWGIVSIYKFCKDFNLKFKLYFNHPFKLQEYLVPNKVDWEIEPEELKYDLTLSRPKYISMVTKECGVMYEILKKRLRCDKIQQHIYTNTRIIEKKEFGKLFREIFKMSPTLKKSFDGQIERIGRPYVSCTFRFQQLLGDFKEEGFTTLESEERKAELIGKCKETLSRLSEYTKSPVLVTSDSITFLESISGMKDIITVKGKIMHPDYDRESSGNDLYMKSFLDLFMLANAEKIFLCNVRPLYRSGFPETASCIYNRPYYEIMNFDTLDIIQP